MPLRRLKFEVLSPRLVLDGQAVQVLGYTTSTHELPGLDNESRLQIVDLNQDGLLDIVAFSFSPEPEKNQIVHTLLRTETKDFKPLQSWDVGQAVRGIKFGDVNGDGFTDILNGTGETIVTLLNQGNGGTSSEWQGFSAPHTSHVGQPIRRIEFGDVNGDGYTDILTGTGKTIATLLNLGTNDSPSEWLGFGAPNTTAFELDIDSVRAGDLDGDGLDDLIILRLSTYTLTSNGDGTFSDPIRYNGGVFEVADINRDGHLDLVSSGRILLNDGTGILESSLNQSPFVGMASFADLDLDDNLDMVVIDELGMISFEIGQGDGTFESFNGQQLRPPSGRIVGTLRVGDINHDGIPDLVAARDGDSLHPWISPTGMLVWIGLGNHRFRPFGGTGTLEGGSSRFRILDFEHSGRNQILFHLGDQLRIIEVNEAFNSATVYDSRIDDVSPPIGTTEPVDVTGDGLPDVVTGGLTHNGISLKLESNGQTTEHLLNVPTEYGIKGSIRFSDVDNDGVFEVIEDHAHGFAVISLKGGENKIAASREGDFNEDSRLRIEDIEATLDRGARPNSASRL